MNSETKQPLMMSGTGSKNSYLVVARRGGFVFGVKPEIVADGENFGCPGTTWFGARIRSAMAGDMFNDSQEHKVVVSIADMSLTTATAWPSVTWENSDETRSSSVIGVLLRGKPDGTEDEIQAFLAEVDKGVLASKMADYVAGLVGEEYLIIPVSDIKEWFDSYYRTLVKKIMHNIKANKAVKDAMEESIGVFGMHAQIIKKALEKAQAQSGELLAEDKEDPAGEV